MIWPENTFTVETVKYQHWSHTPKKTRTLTVNALKYIHKLNDYKRIWSFSHYQTDLSQFTPKKALCLFSMFSPHQRHIAIAAVHRISSIMQIGFLWMKFNTIGGSLILMVNFFIIKTTGFALNSDKLICKYK